MSSMQEYIESVRKPRVHIKYEVETEGASIEKELPFVVGVMGDFSGNQPGKPLKSMKERKFIDIDKDNFNDVMEKITPGLKIEVNNFLNKQSENLKINLEFKSLEDFEPSNLINQIPELRKLKEIRDKLRDLLNKSDRSDKLESILETALNDEKTLNLLANQLGLTNEKKREEKNEPFK